MFLYLTVAMVTEKFIAADCARLDVIFDDTRVSLPHRGQTSIEPDFNDRHQSSHNHNWQSNTQEENLTDRKDNHRNNALEKDCDAKFEAHNEMVVNVGKT